MPPRIDLGTATVLVVMISFIVTLVLTVIVIKINDFNRELNYINMEIGRTRGEEQRYWKREKRRLWLSLLPFYRR